MNRTATIFVSLIVLILIGALGYFIFQNQRLIGELAKSPSQTASPEATPSSPPTASPESSPARQLNAATTQNAIKTNVASKNYQGLIPYMADPLQVILQATECCGPKTPQEAVDQMTYIDEGVPFNFDQNNETIKNLKAKNQELEGRFIGISQAKEHLVAFGLDNENKIADIRLSVSWKLFNL